MGKWAWSSDGETHDHFIVFKDDNSCSFENLKGRTVKAYDGQCTWKINMKSLQLKMTIPTRIAGGFIDHKMSEVKLSQEADLEPSYYEAMVLGRWAWSSDGKNHDHFIVFKEGQRCSFQDLNNRTIMAYEGQCRWKILMKSLQLKMTVPERVGGGFID